MKQINSFRGEYWFLSNFYICPVEYEGRIYPSSENAFQAAKTLDPAVRDKFINISPGEAKKLGRKIKLRDDWEVIKGSEMIKILSSKFIYNEDLKNKLLKTNSDILVEGNTWHDNYWGNCTCNKCKDKEGENVLGSMLMFIRCSLSISN